MAPLHNAVSRLPSCRDAGTGEARGSTPPPQIQADKFALSQPRGAERGEGPDVPCASLCTATK